MPTKAASDIDPTGSRDASVPLERMHAQFARMARLESTVNHLRSEYQDHVRIDCWQGYADKLAAGVCEAIGRLQGENEELEKILAGVTSQLARLESWSADASVHTESQRRSAINLERGVRDQVASLQSDVADSVDLQVLKRQVNDKLISVTDRLTEFRKQEERRLGQIEAQNQALQERLSALHARSERLRAEFDAQKELLMHDALTGVLSRHAYEIRLAEEFARWERYGAVFAYTFWDVDNFKSVNDTHGHKSGDMLLRQIATILDRYTRSTDIVARIGGEEFVILMPSTTADQARVVAGKLREMVSRSRFSGFAENQRFSVSCGISEVRAGDSISALTERADVALYKAKSAGKNRCVIG